jgi:hypothetical protein
MHPSRRQDREKTLLLSNNSQEDHPLRYVTELRPNDVLMGRGAPIINYEGNVRFRDLVRTRKADYVHTTRHQVKDEIARDILQEIKRREGHFLRRIDSESELRRLGISETTKAWIVVENDVALEKVKQALRDKDLGKRNDDDLLLGSNQIYPAPDFSSEARSVSAPYLSNAIDWVGGQRSHFHELLKSHSAPSNLALHASLQGRPSIHHPMAGYIPAQGEQLQQNQSFAASLPPVLSYGTGFRTGDYLREFLRRNQTLAYPSTAISQIVGDTNLHSRCQSQENSLCGRSSNHNHRLPLSHGSFESTGRLTNEFLPPIAHPMESTHLDASSNTHLAVLHSLLEERKILLQRQMRFGTNTHSLDFSPYTAAAHARMPPVSSREKVETNQMEAKNTIQCPSSLNTSADRKRKATY